MQVLGRHPDASLDHVAAAAGVSRQTIYAHYSSRQVLLAAVIDRITADVVAALEAAELDSGTATEALLRWLEASWRLLDHYPLLLHPAATAVDASESERQHAPVVPGLERLIRRGQQTGEFDPGMSPAWLVAATIALGHAAGAEIAAGRMTSGEATAAVHHSILRVYGTRS